jgi:hypothetical protein
MLFILALVTTLFLGQSSTPQLRSEWGVVLPPDYWPSNMYKWCSRDAPGRSGYWAPDSETVGALETVLAPALHRALEQKITEPSRRPAANEYFRQYIGIRIGRRQVVYINGFHKSYVERLATTRPELADTWRTHAVNVCDGGSSFFGAEYDPATRQVVNIRFNGPG